MTDELFHGTGKFYNQQKSFGFIIRDDGAADVYVGRHHGAGLHAGDAVSFEIEIGHDERQRAINVKVLRASGSGNGEAQRERVWRHDGVV